MKVVIYILPRKSDKSVKIIRDYWSVLVICHHELDYRLRLLGETIGNIGQTTGKTIGDIGNTG